MLIQPDYIKANFPQWEHYCEFAVDEVDTQITLTLQIENGSIELADYVTVTADSITPAIRRHLFHIIRKNLFMLKHADSEFDHRPQILKDYEHSIKMLTELRQGDRPNAAPTPETAQQSLKVTAKKRRYDSWFRDTGGYITSSGEN